MCGILDILWNNVKNKSLMGRFGVGSLMNTKYISYN